MEQILSKLLEHGLPGLFIAILFWKNWDLTKRLREVEDSRHVETKDHLAAFNDMKIALESFKSEIRAKLDSVRDAIIQGRK